MAESDKHRELLFKVLIVGDIGTGKTSIIKRYVHGIFSNHYKSTIGVDFALKVLNWDPKTTIRIQLWDIAGQERFGNMTRVYYKEAVGAIVVFDVTRPTTLESVRKWKNDIDTKVSMPDTGDLIPTVLLANKIDLVNDSNALLDPLKMDEFCQENGFSQWFKTSAKENVGINEAMHAATKAIVDKISPSFSFHKQIIADTVDLNRPMIAPYKTPDCLC